MEKLVISSSPHIHDNLDVPKIMWGVVIALIPAFLVSIYFFGLKALILTLTSVISCVIFEYLINKYLFKSNTITIYDGSAVVTGLLLAFNVPSSLPLWQIIIGSLVAIGIGKMTFGGLGKNPFNPALVARVFLLISFPVDMTTWPKPEPLSTKLTDFITGPTALGIYKEGILNNEKVSHIMTKVPSYTEMFLGKIGGSLGEVSAIAILIGAAFMFIRRIITLHIPFSYIITVIIFSGIFWLINPERYIDPLFHVLSGGLLLGAFFMATDMVTSPMTPKGQIIFGIGCGLLTVIIRNWGSYPEGVSFAILIMNAFTPLINKYVKTKKFGSI